MDPPQGLEMGDWDAKAWGPQQFELLISQLKSVSSSQKMCLVVFCTINMYDGIKRAMEQTGWKHVHCVVWHKTNKLGGGGRHFTHVYELLVFGWKTSVHNGVWSYEEQSIYKQDLWDFPHIGSEHMMCTDDHKVVNRCQKPLKLLKHLVSHHTSPVGCVLDLFAGSHSLMFACMEVGRNCFSIERDERQHTASYQNLRQLIVKKTAEDIATAKSAEEEAGEEASEQTQGRDEDAE